MKKSLFTWLAAPRRRNGQEPPRKMTNGDRIRAMDNQELALWCRDNVSCAVCPMLEECHGAVYSCHDRWRAYLDKEVEA